MLVIFDKRKVTLSKCKTPLCEHKTPLCKCKKPISKRKTPLSKNKTPLCEPKKPLRNRQSASLHRPKRHSLRAMFMTLAGERLLSSSFFMKSM